jgi:hypothetical protein
MLATETKMHDCDADCAPFLITGRVEMDACSVCGVVFDDPCAACGGRGFHRMGCQESER